MKENLSIQMRSERGNEMLAQLTETKGALGNGFGEDGKITKTKTW